MSEAALSVFRAARVEPTRPAVVCSGATLDFAALAARAGRCIAWLRRRGVTPGRPVAVVPRVDVETLSLLHGLVAWGVPVVLVHPRLTAAERRFVVDDSGAEVFVEDPATELAEAEGLEPEQPAMPDADRAPLAILYTSGTTGRPKGAILSRAAFAAAAAASAENLGWGDDDRWLLCMPLAHVGGLSIVTRTLLARRAVVLPEGARKVPFDAPAVLDALVRHRVTLLSVVPTMMKRLLDAGDVPKSVRAILLGGAATPARLLQRCAELELPALTTYGLTEACSQVTTQRRGTRPDPAQGSGPPMAGVGLRIGEGDRIEVRGPTLMNGYHPPGAHAEPFVDGGWFRTEDLGRLDAEGRLHVLGRRQELVVTGGENVYPLEVELVVDAAPGVRASCVFGIDDDEWGQIVCAAIVTDGGAIDGPTLARFFAERLASHKRPRRIAQLDELPVTAAGKLDRRAVPALATPHLRPLTSP